ncbi:MAG: hypothetical protein M3Z66_06175 [Chloroflexota bacterium]|nr:hypothetical protein [Chloroflexota bacterium]
MAFGSPVLSDRDDLLDRVERAVQDKPAAAAIVDAIEQLHADYAEWFRDDAMRGDPPPGRLVEPRRR